ncbi:acyltransferase family protein [Phycisphaera mikurensis]|uniref:Putative acyltransferase n=1 Tax=Phycisphaera mikurensis (strain NBRC 102666 / KCTC 22515 / FYK2301M01) TaxID=1142394 RepID=I0IAL3_PHYMF|nr:acyltransferase [Phycisphaera mikurensis]MBB6441703.1 peptidoglycan/LPS O-acetylase OafA/YrhL [Phycisphaera mikurensis]BAM02301.1 putative acyltransferase [Phycisphaera mikurensis NBRC 102666]
MTAANPAVAETAPAGAAARSGALGYEAWRATRFFSCLDGLRAISILAVVWHHAGGGTLPSVGLSRGFLGVDVFFAISGFLIVTLLLRERDRHGGISLRGFYARRSLRIFPVYYAFLFGIAGAYALLKPDDPTTGDILASLPAAAFYVSNFVVIPAGLLHVTWSLATEEQFYMLWAPAEKFLRKAGVYVLLAAVIAASLAVSFGLLDPWIGAVYGYDEAGVVNLPSVLGTTLLPIALGVVLAHLLHAPRGFAAVRRVAGFPGAPAFWFVAVCLGIFLVPGDIRGLTRPLLQLGMVLALAALLLRDDGPLGRSLRWKPLARIGVVSYGIYLFHKPVLVAVEAAFAGLGLPGRTDGLPGTVLLTIAAAAATWGVSELSFRFFEMPFLKLKKRFATTQAGAADVR